MKLTTVLIALGMLTACATEDVTCDEGLEASGDDCVEIDAGNTKTAPGDEDEDPDTTPPDTTPPGTTSDPMTPAEFMQLFGDLFCAEYATCNPDIDCVPEGGQNNGCQFDPVAADGCLTGEYICDNSFGPGFEFVVVPLACGEVFYNCP